MTELIIGTMSGTSLDGVDVAVLKTDGNSVLEAGSTYFRKYSAEERQTLKAAMDAYGRPRLADDDVISQAEKVVTNAHFEAIKSLMEETQLSPSQVSLIGFHGQTLFHAPHQKVTVQIGDGDGLAKRLGTKVAYDFRSDDVAAGGEGAPLVPIFHKAMLDQAGILPPAAVVNIGGVANATIILEEDLIAFDTGPGNALIDDWITSRTSKKFDQWGRIASQGKVLSDHVETWLSDPYFDRPAPKSLDRNNFSMEAIDRASLADGAATLTAFTAQAIAKGLAPYEVASLYVCGGGAKNRTMMAMLEEATGLKPIQTEEIGFDGDYVEAQAFAYLAKRVEAGLPLTFPGTTGVSAPLAGGKIAKP